MNHPKMFYITLQIKISYKPLLNQIVNSRVTKLVHPKNKIKIKSLFDPCKNS